MLEPVWDGKASRSMCMKVESLFCFIAGEYAEGDDAVHHVMKILGGALRGGEPSYHILALPKKFNIRINCNNHGILLSYPSLLHF